MVLIKSLLGGHGFNIEDVARPKPVEFVVKQLKPFQGKEWCVIGQLDGKRKPNHARWIRPDVFLVIREGIILQTCF